MSILMDALMKGMPSEMREKLATMREKTGKCSKHGVFTTIALPAHEAQCPHCIKASLVEFDRHGFEQLHSPDMTPEAIAEAVGIPRLFAPASLETFSTERPGWGRMHAWIEFVLGEIETSRKERKPVFGLLLGGVGVGKSFTACTLANATYRRRMTTSYFEHRRLWGTVNDTYRANGYVASRRLFTDPDVLVIDEVLSQDHEGMDSLLREVIEARFNEAKSTVFVSNLNLQEFQTAIGPRCTDRLATVAQCCISGDSCR